MPPPILDEIALCIQRGKGNTNSPFPPDLKGRKGASELTLEALADGIAAQAVLNDGLIAGMKAVGERFRNKEIYVPEVLLAARAMKAAMEHLKPYFSSDALTHRGTFIIGSVAGDLHDIGKRLVGMVVEGSGWNVIDLGTSVQPQVFLEALEANPHACIGLSALLTTTMPAMKETVQVLKVRFPSAMVIVGGAPITEDYAAAIGADGYSPDPYGAVEFLAASDSLHEPPGTL